MAQLIGYLSEGEQLQGRLSDPDRLVGELSMPAFLGGGLTDEVKQALLDLFQHLAYTDADGQDYYDALYNAFYPPAELVRITAVYTQTSAVFPDTPLDDLKDDLVVTAHYSDGTSEEVTTYTLSGTLTAGTSVITVTYEDKTTTFNVTVSEPAVLTSISAVYTQSGVVYPTDSLDSLKPDLVVTAHYSDSSTATVTTYTLSGSLTVGTSTITVTYSGKTTTFNVTVTEPVVLDSITATYTQSGTVYDTDSLDSLKADLVVTAVYTDSSTEVVPSTDYTLSGTLTAGTSTITVSYEGKTATFSVTVTGVTEVSWTYTDGLPTVKGFEVYGSGGTETMTENGLSISLSGNGNNRGYSYANTASTGELEVTFRIGSSQTRAYIGFGDGDSNIILIRVQYSTNYKGIYLNNASGVADMTNLMTPSQNTDYTIKLVMDNGYADVYINGTLMQSNVDLSTMVTSTYTTRIVDSPSGNNASVLVLKAMSIKAGSTS